MSYYIKNNTDFSSNIDNDYYIKLSIIFYQLITLGKWDDLFSSWDSQSIVWDSLAQPLSWFEKQLIAWYLLLTADFFSKNSNVWNNKNEQKWYT